MALLQDLRLALRRMRRSPLFALSVAGTLAIGLAATTAILGQGARLAAVGVALGLLCALVLSQFLRTMLFEIGPTDPWTLAVTVVILIVVVGLATLGAARRAAGIEAAVALRQE